MAKRPRRAQRIRSKTSPTGAAGTDSRPTLSPEEQFQQEYAYVLKDLRRVFILAIAMFVLLIILNLVVR